MKKHNKTPLATAMGSLMISGFAVQANADVNPFSVTELANGYTLAAGHQYSNELTAKEGSCGSNADKKTQGAAPKTGSSVKKAEGACGEGKCGGMMNNGKMKPGMENVCGAMMKNKEGSCGMNGSAKPGDAKKSTDMSCGAMMKNKDASAGKSGEMSCGAMMKNKDGSCGSAVKNDTAAGK
ncbi:MAG: hypothetical protein ABSB19_03930 [Methylomonas sp.]|jgi:uncharacterized low-complexity protein